MAEPPLTLEDLATIRAMLLHELERRGHDELWLKHLHLAVRLVDDDVEKTRQLMPEQ
jgi:hypothetical protein